MAHVEHGEGVTGELLAVWGQGDASARAGAQERDADGGFELADLACQGGVLDAEVAGGVLDAGVAGDFQEPAGAYLGGRAGEGGPDGWRESGGSAGACKGGGRALLPRRTGMPAVRRAADRLWASR